MRLFASFDPEEDLIYLSATIFGPLGDINAHLALDTGATITMIRRGILLAIGYDLDSIATKISIVTGSGVEAAKQLTVEKIQAIDQAVDDVTVICHDLPEETGLDGLLGLNFLRHFDIEINYSTSTLALSPISS
jgi:predicted aspartyl protease